MGRPASQQQDQNTIRDTIRQGIAGAQTRTDPQAGRTQLGGVTQIDNTRQDQYRGREMALADSLGRVASGQERGAGELAVGRQVGNALGQAYGAATMARGNSGAGAARAGARAAGAIGLGGAGMAQQAALSDQMGARSQLAGVLGQGRAADIGVAGQNAGAQNASTLQQGQMDQATQLANLTAQLQARGMNDQAIQQYLAQLAQNNQFNMARTDARSVPTSQIVGGALGQGAQIGAQIAASDVRVKTEIADATNEMDVAIAALTPYRYAYIDPDAHGEGSRVGIMAQDLAATDAGAPVVVECDGVLMIDGTKAISFLLAAVARLGAQVRDLNAERTEKAGV